MPASLIEWYDKMVNEGALSHDAAQAMIVKAFQNVVGRVNDAAAQEERRIPFWKKWLGGAAVPTAAGRGIYVYGGVGRGKTMVMDQAFARIHVAEKRRCHFNDFMLDVHRRLKAVRHKAKDSDAEVMFLDEVAAEIAAESHVLAFDEFQVRDIADAMIMKGLFEALFARGVTVMATSNVAPDDLYKGGLQRGRFLPFIDVLKAHMDVIHMDSETDYRLQEGQVKEADMSGDDGRLNDLYLTPMNTVSYKRLENAFAGYTAQPPHPHVVAMAGREWHVETAVAGKACFISFAEACEKPRAAEDYLALAAEFPVVFLHDVPKMGYDRRNEAKRFILLIDTLYDKNCDLVISAEAEPDKLYYGHDHEFEFQRTISRLQEMRRRQLGEGATDR